MLLNPFCPFSTARILALRATVLLLLTLLIKAKVRIAAFLSGDDEIGGRIASFPRLLA